MVRHLLVAFDGSQPARKALQFARDLVQQTQAKLTVMLVMEYPRILPVAPLGGFVMTAPASDPKDLERAQHALDDALGDLPPAGVEKKVALGNNVADVICEEGTRLNADMIIVGARGRSVGGRWLLGSISDRIVHHAGRPVTVVH